MEFLGLGQSSEAGEQERRQVLRLVLIPLGPTSSLTQTSPPSHLQLQGSWEAAALSNNNTKTAGESTLASITDTGQVDRVSSVSWKYFNP